MSLITPWYLEEQRRLHRMGGYGQSSGKWARIVMKIAERHDCKTVLDYGCGQCQLGDVIRASGKPIEMFEYDPAIDGKNKLPPPCDLVFCGDVLEHIELECVDDVMRHIASLTNKVFVGIASLRLSENRFLSDGRNAHVLIQHGHWWTKQVEKHGLRIIDHMTKVGEWQDKHADEWRALAVRVKPQEAFEPEAVGVGGARPAKRRRLFGI